MSPAHKNIVAAKDEMKDAVLESATHQRIVGAQSTVSAPPSYCAAAISTPIPFVHLTYQALFLSNASLPPAFPQRRRLKERMRGGVGHAPHNGRQGAPHARPALHARLASVLATSRSTSWRTFQATSCRAQAGGPARSGQAPTYAKEVGTAFESEHGLRLCPEFSDWYATACTFASAQSMPSPGNGMMRGSCAGRVRPRGGAGGDCGLRLSHSVRAPCTLCQDDFQGVKRKSHVRPICADEGRAPEARSDVL